MALSEVEPAAVDDTVVLEKAPGHAVDDRLLRIPTIAADLLPLEIVEARRGRKVRRVVLVALAGFAALLALWFASAAYGTRSAQQDVDRTDVKVLDLTRKQKTYSDLVKTQNDSKSISKQLSTLMANDLQWSHLYASVQGAAPSGVSVTSLTGALYTDPAEASAANELPSTSAYLPIGTLNLAGVGSSKAAVAAYVDALGKVSGVANPLLNGATEEDNGKVNFSVGMQITKAALGGRYSSPTPAVGK